MGVAELLIAVGVVAVIGLVIYFAGRSRGKLEGELEARRKTSGDKDSAGR